MKERRLKTEVRCTLTMSLCPSSLALSFFCMVRATAKDREGKKKREQSGLNPDGFGLHSVSVGKDGEIEMRKAQPLRSDKAGDRLQMGTAERGRRGCGCGGCLGGNTMRACVLLGVDPC